jgi:ribonucleoside-triphosphate reductase
MLSNRGAAAPIGGGTVSDLLSRSVVTDGVTDFCQGCGRQLQRCEVYSRIVGYLRPVQNWNVGKKQEWKDRVTYDQPTPDQLEATDPAVLRKP